MTDRDEQFRQALAAFYKAAVAFARQDDDKQEERKRKEIVRKEIERIRGGFAVEWVTPTNAIASEDCYPPCIKGWVCVNGDCQRPVAFGGSSPIPR